MSYTWSSLCTLILIDSNKKGWQLQYSTQTTLATAIDMNAVWMSKVIVYAPRLFQLSFIAIFLFHEWGCGDKKIHHNWMYFSVIANWHLGWNEFLKVKTRWKGTARSKDKVGTIYSFSSGFRNENGELSSVSTRLRHPAPKSNSKRRGVSFLMKTINSHVLPKINITWRDR